MTLEFHKLAAEVHKMAAVEAERHKRNLDRLEQVRQFLQKHSTALEWLKEKAGKAAGYRGATPGDEPLGQVYDLPDQVSQATIIAVDGSQIYPDQHAIARYYVINVGVIVFRQGSGQAPEVNTYPELNSSPYKESGELIHSAEVNTIRTFAEVERLAETTKQAAEAGEKNIVSLLDMPLLFLTIPIGETEEPDRETLQRYLALLNRMRETGAVLAGYTDQPGSTGVIRLLELAESKDVAEAMGTRPFGGLLDRYLFAGLLEPGQRSALFSSASPVNKRLDGEGHRIFFFYLNVGTEQGTVIARVEVPEWVVDRGAQLNLLHRILWQQTRSTQGYPYVLARADELAVVTYEERQELERMIQRALMSHNIVRFPSKKSTWKAWARG